MELRKEGRWTRKTLFKTVAVGKIELNQNSREAAEYLQPKGQSKESLGGKLTKKNLIKYQE